MKIPDPIIEPTTIIVPSNKPMARTKPGSDFALVSARGCVVSAIRRIASAGCRVVSGSQQIDVLPGAHPRLGCADDIADHRHRLGPHLDYLTRSLQPDSSHCQN